MPQPADETATPDHAWGFRTRAIHAGNIPDAVTRRPRAADLPDERVRLRRHRGCRGPLRPAEVRQHLQPPREPDGRQLRGAHRLARGRPRRRRHRIRSRRASSSPSPRSPVPATTSSPAASLYGGSITQLDVTLRRFGVDTTFVARHRPGRLRRRDHRQDQADLRRDRSRTPPARSPTSRVSPTWRTPHHIPLIVDSTVATPYLNRPIEWGADVVIHSATKFLGGAGTTLGGVVVESGRFHWANEHFPLFDQPVPHYGGLNWHGNFGEYAFLTRLRAEQLRDIGPALAPHSAWLLAHGRRDAAVPHAGARRQRPHRRRVARSRRPHRVRQLGGPAHAPALRAREEVPARRGRARCSASG